MSLDKISIAPMLDCTDRHFRRLIRLISKKVMLYTEMTTIKQFLEDKTNQVLAIDPVESPVALQLGGSAPELLAECVQRSGTIFQEINLNVGCPSGRVQSGGIGACLMLQPTLVADCIAAMSAVATVPITVKCRLGVDDQDSYDQLTHFIATVAEAGCQKFIIHARKAWLKGLSPKQNREIPPLDYEKTYQLKKDFPSLTFIINGGIDSLDAAAMHLNQIDGVMIGRAVYNNPFLLAEVDQRFYGQQNAICEPELVANYIDYVAAELAKGVRLSSITRHMLGLFYNKPKASQWRRYLSCNSIHPNAGIEVITAALEAVIA